MQAFLFIEIFERYEIPNADLLAKSSFAAVGQHLRGSLKSRSKILKRELSITQAAAYQLLARMLEFQHWHECQIHVANLEAEPTILLSPEQANNLFAIMAEWAEPNSALGENDPAKQIATRLLPPVVITHLHGHRLSKILDVPLSRGLELAAKLHGAPSWAACVYNSPYWVAMAKN